MTIFIKPGPITETLRGEEHGFGHSKCLAQSPQYPFDVELWHYGNFKSNEIFPLENHHTPRISPGNKGEIQQLKIGNSTHNFVDPPDRLEDRICPNMTNEQFIEEFNEIRDKLVKILENRVIPSVNQWSPQIRERAIKWFGTDSEKLKLILQNGYPKCVSVLKQLSGENFLKPSTGIFLDANPIQITKGFMRQFAQPMADTILQFILAIVKAELTPAHKAPRLAPFCMKFAIFRLHLHRWITLMIKFCQRDLLRPIRPKP